CTPGLSELCQVWLGRPAWLGASERGPRAPRLPDVARVGAGRPESTRRVVLPSARSWVLFTERAMHRQAVRRTPCASPPVCTAGATETGGRSNTHSSRSEDRRCSPSGAREEGSDQRGPKVPWRISLAGRGKTRDRVDREADLC